MAVAVTVRIRLDKYLADMGYGTRSEIKKEIVKGNIRGKRRCGKKTGDENRYGKRQGYI